MCIRRHQISLQSCKKKPTKANAALLISNSGFGLLFIKEKKKKKSKKEERKRVEETRPQRLNNLK